MSWKGVSFDSLAFLSQINSNAPPVNPSATHAVLFELPLLDGHDPRPLSQQPQSDEWNEDHVRMPNSPSSLYPTKFRSKSANMASRWELICNAYKNPIKSADQLQHAILQYNHLRKWNLVGLKNFINEEMSKEDREHFFEATLPGIVDLALSITDLITTPIPLLQKDSTSSISMSQKQAACLLANCFLCTFPDRDQQKDQNYPSFSFCGVFNDNKPRIYEKLKCILHYFDEIISKGRDGVITFSRQNIRPQCTPLFEESTKPIPKLHISSVGGIEDAAGLLQMDFADPYIGGIVLTFGLAQEEIRFLLSPELIVSRLFTEKLGPRDAFVIIGSERFSKGTGYGYRFKWSSPHLDNTPRDEYRRRLCQVVALDAIRYRSRSSDQQYQQEFIQRDLVKAYAGFRMLDGSLGSPVAVATGNWGCGIFKGNPQLKGLVQLAAAGEAGRDLAYYTFKDQKLKEKLASMHDFLSSKEVTVGQLIKILFQYGSNPGGADGHDLYQYIRARILNASRIDNT